MDTSNVEFERQQNKGLPVVAQAVSTGPLKVCWGHQIEKRQIEWLWERYIPRGTLTMITGDPAAGKSTLICELLAALSKARPLPGETERKGAEVSWVMNAEDGAEDTIIWRLDNQGADSARILVTDAKVPLEGKALEQLEATVTKHRVAIVVVDTLATWMEGGVDMNDAKSSVQWLNEFMGIARRTRCAIVFLRHKRKNGGGNKMYQGTGSIAFTGTVRSELLVTSQVAADGAVIRTVEKIKGTVGRAPALLHYVIRETDNAHGRLEWLTLAEAGPKVAKVAVGAVDGCRTFLRVALKDGARKMQDVHGEAMSAGFNKTNIKDARKGLVRAFRPADSGPKSPWMWELQTDSGRNP